MSEYVRIATINFKYYKSLADKSFEQLNDSDFHFKFDDEANSIALLIQHMSGNAKSRFTDFFTSDGEKPDRNRDSEFEDKTLTKAELIQLWETGWKIVFDLLAVLKDEDLFRKVKIRSEEQLAMEALNRQVAHYAYHVGQIVLIAKHLKGKDWNTLSIAKGKSEEFNKNMIKK